MTSTYIPLWRVGLTALLLYCGAAAGPVASAQTPALTNAAAAEQEPLKCWWRTNKQAVFVGERFTVVLTCSLLETPELTVVPDLGELDPTNVQLTPYEVTGGSRHDDQHAAPWHFLQLQYTVRLLDDRFFGQDAPIPALNVRYRIRTSTRGGQASGDVEGREQIYVLPPLPLRVLSLVPQATGDIQDSSMATFAASEEQRARGTRKVIAGAVSLGVAAIFGIAAVAQVVRRRGKRVLVNKSLSPASLMRLCLREAARLRSDIQRGGWTPELAGGVASVFRVAAAVAQGDPVAQTLDTDETPARDGQLVVSTGIIRRKSAVLSAPTTPDSIRRHLESRQGRQRDARVQAMLTALAEALRVLDGARYARQEHFDAAALEVVLDNGMNEMRRLRFARLRSASPAEQFRNRHR